MIFLLKGADQWCSRGLGGLRRAERIFFSKAWRRQASFLSHEILFQLLFIGPFTQCQEFDFKTVWNLLYVSNMLQKFITCKLILLTEFTLNYADNLFSSHKIICHSNTGAYALNRRRLSTYIIEYNSLIRISLRRLGFNVHLVDHDWPDWTQDQLNPARKPVWFSRQGNVDGKKGNYSKRCIYSYTRSLHVTHPRTSQINTGNAINVLDQNQRCSSPTDDSIVSIGYVALNFEGLFSSKLWYGYTKNIQVILKQQRFYFFSFIYNAESAPICKLD